MIKYAVVTDSASDISKEYADKLGISIIPIYINYEGKAYRDRIDIDAETIYKLQKEKNAVFKSSSPSPFDFVKIYEKFIKNYEKIMLKIQPKINFVNTIITECTPVVGAHTDPGLIGIIICKLNDELRDLFIIK